jgi:hypothetical protein
VGKITGCVGVDSEKTKWKCEREFREDANEEKAISVTGKHGMT